MSATTPAENKTRESLRTSDTPAGMARSTSCRRSKAASAVRESHRTAVCGSFKSFLLTSTHHQSANPTSRQCVDRSSPFYSKKQIPDCVISRIVLPCTKKSEAHTPHNSHLGLSTPLLFVFPNSAPPGTILFAAVRELSC